MLNNGELFESQECEGDNIRRMRAAPEPEAPQVVVRWLPIFKVTDTGKLFPVDVLFDTYEKAREASDRPCEGTEFVGIRLVRIEL